MSRPKCWNVAHVLVRGAPCFHHVRSVRTPNTHEHGIRPEYIFVYHGHLYCSDHWNMIHPRWEELRNVTGPVSPANKPWWGCCRSDGPRHCKVYGVRSRGLPSICRHKRPKKRQTWPHMMSRLSPLRSGSRVASHHQTCALFFLNHSLLGGVRGSISSRGAKIEFNNGFSWCEWAAARPVGIETSHCTFTRKDSPFFRNDRSLLSTE